MKLHPIWRYGLGFGAVLGIVEALLTVARPYGLMITLMSVAAVGGFFLISREVVQRTGKIGHGVVAVIIATILVSLISAYSFTRAFFGYYDVSYQLGNGWLILLFYGGIPGILIALAGGAVGKRRWAREHSAQVPQP